VKAKYRNELVQKTIAPLERKQELKLNVLQALHLVAEAWSSVNSDSVVHCFSTAKFRVATFNMNVDNQQRGKAEWKTYAMQ
jgi:hypothetical protein